MDNRPTAGTTTATVTPATETAVLFASNLDCAFLNSTTRQAQYHASVSGAVASACANAGGACTVEDAVSVCGSTVTTLTLLVQSPPRGYNSVAALLKSSASNGTLSVMFEGSLVTPLAAFPTLMPVSVEYANNLVTLAPSASDIAELTASLTHAMVTAFPSLGTVEDAPTTALVPTPAGFEFVMTFNVKTVAE